MADTITALVGAMMQMPIGPLTETVARIDPSSMPPAFRPTPPSATSRGATPAMPGVWAATFARARAWLARRFRGRRLRAVIKDMARDLLAMGSRTRRRSAMLCLRTPPKRPG